MIDRIERLIRGFRRRISRSEWAIRWLGLPVSEGTGSQPGVVLIQMDGLSRTQMEQAMKRGRLPFLRGLLAHQHYETHTFYPGLPSSTPAVQAELHYGVRGAVPSFGFIDRSTQRVFTMLSPDSAAEVEARLRQKGEGLLQGGSSWSNIYRGGAAEEESHFCAASMGFRDLFRSRPLIRLLTFPLLHFSSLLRAVLLLGLEFCIAFRDLFRGLTRGESPLEELRAVFNRVFVCIGLRELLTIGVKIDVARGLPIIHVNFVGYDEQAHRRGPSSAFAHWSLGGIDRAVKSIYRAAQRSARRDYQVWVFSDHGQERCRFFDQIQGTTLEHVIADALEGAVGEAASQQNAGDRPVRTRFRGERSRQRSFAEWFRQEVLTRFEERPFTVTALGPVGHLYLKEKLDLPAQRTLATTLVGKGGVPGALLCDASGGVEWFHAKGSIALATNTPDFLPHPESLRNTLVRDLVNLCHHESAGDLVLLGWGPDVPLVSFANERGSHAGPGLEETQGFALLPESTPLPEHPGAFLRPTDLRAAVRHVLERETLTSPRSRKAPSIRSGLRVMTYNVHSCLGMDGRVSPGRIARVIERYQPDLVALQELDFGRLRSQRHDQSRLIAGHLGMHLTFCPTVIDRDEQYGHALLSRVPMKVVRTEILRGAGGTRHVEPRGALWMRLNLLGREINLMNTHLGLRRRERLLQTAELLDPDWMGAIGRDEPIILCGDFNMSPGSAPYRALTRRLQDVQLALRPLRPLNTFSTWRPLLRIDHILVSHHFRPTQVLVPRNHLTRVASDHLPLIADLVVQESAF
ncbi:MAG: endonuclease/exonuclease/phosphatase family protein [Verrucomicrobia bacterium]|jgi:endonuclease/exonuclease/phosphatase family metal-dependent hydrolase|nr:endonuclease/exonuclease/phosphatase family protein [Verrucomicrobiota bacterium]